MKTKIEQLLQELTLKEKISLLAGESIWTTMPVPRLGIPSLVMTDGPLGVRADPYRPDPLRKSGFTMAFPAGIAMAASWDVDLLEKVGVALGEETRAMGCDILLGPCINIMRTPLAGRNFESFSEDPFLAGRVGVAYVKGLQNVGVGASLKHYAANNQEIERSRGSSEIDERTLREIYLPAFEAVVKEAQPWTVMCSYNRINGVYASENHYLLTEILREEWGYEGVVISDWGAVHSTAPSINAGLDIEMPGPTKWRGSLLDEAVWCWQVGQETIDQSARQVLEMRAKTGKLASQWESVYEVNTPGRRKVAHQLAIESITLLKNEDDILPIDAEKVESIAVIGPFADQILVSGGGSSFVDSPFGVSPLSVLQDALGKDLEVSYGEGCTVTTCPAVLDPRTLTPLDQAETPNVWRAEFFDNPEFAGEPIATQHKPKLERWWWPLPEGVSEDAFHVRCTAEFTAPANGLYDFTLLTVGEGRFFINGELRLHNEMLEDVPDDWSGLTASVQVELVQGKQYQLWAEYHKPLKTHWRAMEIMLEPVCPTEMISEAVALAEKSDLALVFAGLPTGFESESADRPDMGLPGAQNELIQAVAAANPNTVVVLYCGAPVEMPWLNDIAGLLLAYYPGQEGGWAVVDLLLGAANPCGKLPVTFPRQYRDNPTFINYPGDRKAHYSEGLFVGYRYYDVREVEPLFPFGFGLSYTQFEYADLVVSDTFECGEALKVAVKVTNTGSRPGKEVVQLYVRDCESSVARPLQELKSFQKIQLSPGVSQTVKFELRSRAFSFYDPLKNDWVLEPGEFEIRVGSSSRDIRLRKMVVAQR